MYIMFELTSHSHLRRLINCRSSLSCIKPKCDLIKTITPDWGGGVLTVNDNCQPRSILAGKMQILLESAKVQTSKRTAFLSLAKACLLANILTVFKVCLRLTVNFGQIRRPETKAQA